MFRLNPKAKMCQSVSVDGGTLRVEYLDGKIAKMLVGTPLSKETREPAQISMMPIDKKFRRWVAKEIKNIFEMSDTMEDAEKRMLFIVDNMLKVERSVLIRLEKE
jgi:hypothetical protein